MNEVEFLNSLKKMLRDVQPQHVSLENDCAVVTAHRSQLLVTTDMLLDGVHFDLNTASIADVARKAILVNISDIAASAGKPQDLFVSLAIPRHWPMDQAVLLMKHMTQTAQQWGAAISGGDTNTTSGPLTINVTAIGQPHWRGTFPRTGAKPGDLIYVTGSLGGSFKSSRHLRFTPRVHEAQWLADHFNIHAMMDISDGLATDLRRMTNASMLASTIEKDSVPIHHDCTGSREDRWRQAVSDGEDFELLFALDPTDANVLEQRWPWNIRLTCIGVFTEGHPEVFIKNSAGTRDILKLRGYEHS